MEPANLTVRILQEIRDDIRSTNRRLEANEARAEQRHVENQQQFGVMNQRSEVIETALRDMAEQMVMLARGIKAAIEDEHERRLAEIDKRLPH